MPDGDARFASLAVARGCQGSSHAGCWDARGLARQRKPYKAAVLSPIDHFRLNKLNDLRLLILAPSQVNVLFRSIRD